MLQVSDVNCTFLDIFLCTFDSADFASRLAVTKYSIGCVFFASRLFFALLFALLMIQLILQADLQPQNTPLIT